MGAVAGDEERQGRITHVCGWEWVLIPDSVVCYWEVYVSVVWLSYER